MDVEIKPYKFEYPFVRDIYLGGEVDESYNYTSSEELSWKPSTYQKMRTDSGFSDEPEYLNYADGLGYCVFDVVSIHRPFPFQTRVFYTRKFINPDGVEFGKNKLHNTTLGWFKRRISGYRYPYFVIDRGEDAAWKRYRKEMPF